MRNYLFGAVLQAILLNPNSWKTLLNEYVGSDFILDICVIPSLHTIKLGPVNKIYTELSKVVDLKESENAHSIERDDYHGTTLEGPQCDKLFKHMNELEEIVMSSDKHYINYIEVLKKLKTVDTLVQSENLNDNFQKIINDFAESGEKVHDKYGTTIPNKVHIITHHLPAVLKKTKKTLKGLSDQTMENVHQVYSNRMTASNYNIKKYSQLCSWQKITVWD